MSENNQEVKKKGSILVPVLAVITICSVAFSMMQTVYILRLASGSIGNMTYAQTPEEQDESVSREAPEVSPVADPEFSLEHAASVTDPNKPTLSTVEIVNRVSPATVSVYVMGQTMTSSNAPVFTGTGFIVSENGYVVTNRHVVEEAEDPESGYSLTVVVPGYEIPIEAQVVGSDIQTDIAVLKLEEQDEPFPYVTLGDSDTLQVGELVVAIGNPLGKLQGTVTVGVVSALDRQINNNGYTMELIQTDASINSGNSGGPLINSFGEVIGVTNAKISSGEGLGFAIPISDVDEVIQSIINYGYVANRPYLGVTVGNVASDAYYGAVEGVYVVEVDAGSPAEEAGLIPGDMIISLDGVEITRSDDIIDVRDLHVPGDEIPIVIERNGRQLELTLIIGDSYDAE